ncbi:hypothetical protein [Neptuniibacter halophilus]|uniref:hypothetical protein n=1 Tax=Neptuniibacter halophilus TaxID=651666 RepID=UPI002573A32C|nr:hypothetical protein [Neptuniibacter halophilus]
MKRLVFLAPQLQHAQGVVAEFLNRGIEDESIHLLADDAELLELLALRPASVVETTELENDMDWGMVAGGGFGLAAGLVAGSALTPAGPLLSGGALVVSSLLGIGLGGWLGRLVGEETPLALLQKYQHALQQGGILVMVDIPEERMSEIHKAIRQYCPSALVEIVHLHWDHHQQAA